MLEPQIIEQLRDVFSKLDKKIELIFDRSNHDKQNELITMLQDVVATSNKLTLLDSGNNSNTPRFFIKYNGKENGISFSGIPGGHEFTSLVLSILNSDGKGKLPDEGIIERIKNLKGIINLKTYVSLSCDNCPEVVQNLNLMATLNDNITHEMVDGEYSQSEVEKLNIQGVPSVIGRDQLISSGKSSLLELLEKLEEHFGKKTTENINKDLGKYDVLVIGGGPAGASSAIYSARKGLKTALITEKIGGQVQETKGIENVISIPYIEGPQLANKLASHISEYDIKTFEHRRVTNIVNQDNLKEVILDSGEYLSTRSVIVATGAKWKELNVDGEKDYLGKGVAYCPHCDGPYYKGKNVAVIGGGNSGVEAAIDLAGIVNSVTLIEFLPNLKADKLLIDKLNSMPNISIITNAKVSKIVGNKEKVIGIEYLDMGDSEIRSLDLDGIFIQIGLMPNSKFVRDIVEINKFGEIIIDKKCRTSQAGIYAAGDVTDVPYKQIVISMGEGAKAALTAFEDLTFLS